MSIFGDAMSFAFDGVESVGGETITYTYDGVSESIFAVPGNEVSNEASIGGKTLVASRGTDWLIRADRLVIDGNLVEPKRGNVITRADGRKYKVTALGGGPCWRWSDSHEVYMRIQTSKAN